MKRFQKLKRRRLNNQRKRLAFIRKMLKIRRRPKNAHQKKKKP